MALQLADVCRDPGFQDEPGWKEMAVRSMEDQGIPSSGYAATILDFTLEFGGGPDAPEIRFMHNVASEFGCNRTLGESFWTAVTRTAFFDKTSMHPMLRIALMLCNLSAE